MIARPVFLTFDDVLDIHELQLKYYGGSAGARDLGILDSAVMTPQATFDGKYVHNGIFEMAAAYAFHISENQPFIDGNKRTALAAALVFLDINGYELLDPKRVLYQAMIDVSAKRVTKSKLANLFSTLLITSE